MEIRKRKSKNAHALKITGDMTIYTVQNALQELNGMSEIFDKDINLDASEVLECDTAGLQLLLYINKKLKKGCAIELVSSNQLIDSLIDLLGLDFIFQCKEKQ